MSFYKVLKTPIGELTLISENEKIKFVYFEGHADDNVLSNAKSKKDLVLEEASHQIKDYFNYKLVKFSLAIELTGTDFQLQAWKVLTQIPYGKTITYGEQALALGDAKKARPIGGANGKNPIPLIVPCHRVIGKSGSLTGFGGGVKIKEFLLNFESAKPLNGLSKPGAQLTL